LPKPSVKKIAVDLHTVKNYDAYASYKFLEEKIGKGRLKIDFWRKLA
jgi:hypothetical protein